MPNGVAEVGAVGKSGKPLLLYIFFKSPRPIKVGDFIFLLFFFFFLSFSARKTAKLSSIEPHSSWMGDRKGKGIQIPAGEDFFSN